jgi:GNAT superfamily N-acetyltransferase
MSGGGWTIRAAEAGDAPAVAEVAAAAWRDTYAGLLRAETIEAFIERNYNVERVEWRIAHDVFLVAEPEGGEPNVVGEPRIAAFADAAGRDDRVDLFAIYAHPSMRGHGAGSALLAAIRDRLPGKAIAADVLLGNRKGEVFYERRGFVPRERLEEELRGEPVVERRWWLEPDPAPRADESA